MSADGVVLLACGDVNVRVEELSRGLGTELTLRGDEVVVLGD